MDDKDIINRLTLSYYKEITVLDKEHGIFVVQHTETSKLYVKKKADIYSKPVYEQLKAQPIQGVPKTYEIIELDNELIIIEEHISGRNLGEILSEEGSLSKERVIEYSIKLCEVLSRLHKLNPPIIHRDIKPSNVILTDDNRVALIDFGGAKLAATSESRDTHLIGSPGFAAPEQYGFGSSDVHTDIYGIGKLLVALLTGSTDIENVKDKGMYSVIKRCLQLDPKRRYKSATHLEIALLWQKPILKIIAAICILILLIIPVTVWLSTTRTTHVASSHPLPEASQEVTEENNASVEEGSSGDIVSKLTDSGFEIPIVSADDSRACTGIENADEDMTVPTGAYSGDDGEKLVIDDNGLAYYYCIDPTFIEVECPWTETDGMITISLSKMHCDITAKVRDNDYSELVFKSDSKNWNSEVFDKISSDAKKYICSPPEAASSYIPVKDNGEMVVDIGAFRFLVPKQFQDMGNQAHFSSQAYSLVDINADSMFISSAVFMLSETSSDKLVIEYEQLAKTFAGQFLNNLQIGYSEPMKVANQNAYRTVVSGLFDEDFSKLTNQIVSGSVVMIDDPSIDKVLYLFLVQTVGTKDDNTDAYEYILKEATIR